MKNEWPRHKKKYLAKSKDLFLVGGFLCPCQASPLLDGILAMCLAPDGFSLGIHLSQIFPLLFMHFVQNICIMA